MKLLQILSLGITLTLLVSGIGLGGYALSKRISSTTCYECMGLNPNFRTFEGFWIKYPEGYHNAGEAVHHPEWVNETLNNGNVVFIFVWATWCGSCKEQWNDMADAGIVKGEENNGMIGEKYKNHIELFSLDYDSNPKVDEVMKTYHPTPSYPAIPLTLIITKESGNNIVKWYAFEGYSVAVSTLDNILESAVMLKG